MFVEGGRSGARGDGEVSAVRSGREKVRISKVTENQYAADSIDLDPVNTQDVHPSHFVVEGRRSRSLSMHFEMTDPFKLSDYIRQRYASRCSPSAYPDTVQLNLQVRQWRNG